MNSNLRSLLKSLNLRMNRKITGPRRKSTAKKNKSKRTTRTRTKVRNSKNRIIYISKQPELSPYITRMDLQKLNRQLMQELSNYRANNMFENRSLNAPEDEYEQSLRRRLATINRRLTIERTPAARR